LALSSGNLLPPLTGLLVLLRRRVTIQRVSTCRNINKEKSMIKNRKQEGPDERFLSPKTNGVSERSLKRGPCRYLPLPHGDGFLSAYPAGLTHRPPSVRPPSVTDDVSVKTGGRAEPPPPPPPPHPPPILPKKKGKGKAPPPPPPFKDNEH
jgi:hypothetical protein